MATVIAFPPNRRTIAPVERRLRNPLSDARRIIMDEIERLIARLDMMDGDPDFEPEPDEPNGDEQDESHPYWV